MKKRGVSPLIATVLLIAFAVALGAVVMNWGRSYVEDTASSVKEGADKERICSQDVKIDVVKISDVKQVCYGGSGTSGYVYMMIKKTGSKDISALDVIIYGAGADQTNTSLNGTAVNDTSGPRRINLTYDYDAKGLVKKVEVIPGVMLSGALKRCAANSLTVEPAELINCSNL